jgi:curved DNA-binding protein CbpA
MRPCRSPVFIPATAILWSLEVESHIAYANRDHERIRDRIPQMANTLYDVLEVIPTASAETIHAAYRSLIGRYHPDKVAMLGPELQAASNARTKEINFAYDILSDAASRARYDEELRGEGSAPLLPQGPIVDGLIPQSPAPQTPVATGAFPKGTAIRPKSPAVDQGRTYFRAAASQSAAAAPQQTRQPLATLAAAAAGLALLLALPPASNLIFSAMEYSVTGSARFFYDAENPVDAKGDFGSAYLAVLWGWLFANYLFGLIAYRTAVLTGEAAAARFGGRFAATNDRLFLFLMFVCVVAVDELFFSTHTMGNMLADMFILAGAYLGERGIT